MPRKSVRSTQGAMSESEIEAFRLGKWVSTSSSTRTKKARYVDLRPDPESGPDDEYCSIGELQVEFDDGTLWAYPCKEADAIAFALAPSKGGWIEDHQPQGHQI